MGLNFAAVAIVIFISGCWLLAARHLLPLRLPWRHMAVPFGFGAISPLPIVIFQRLGSRFELPAAADLSDAFVIALTMAALPEELLKAGAVVASFWLLRQFTPTCHRVGDSTGFRIPVLCGLGFAAVENIAYSVNASVVSVVGAGIGHPLMIPLLRSLAASLLHASLGCLMGFFFARFANEGHFRWPLAVAGCVAAVIGHVAVDWGLIVPVLTMLQGGGEPDAAALENLAPHFLLALFLIPAVIAAAVVAVLVTRRRLRRQDESLAISLQAANAAGAVSLTWRPRPPAA